MYQEALLFFGMVFIAALLLAQGMMPSLFGENREVRKRLKRRLQMVGESSVSAGASLIREKFLRNLSPWERRLESLPKMAAFAQVLDQAGYRVPAYRIVGLGIGLALVAAVAGYALSGIPLVALGGFALGGALPPLKVLRDRKKRFDDFEKRFPEALDIMIRGMRAGHPFSESLHVAAKELDGPISKEFAIVFYDINFGGDVRRALVNLLERMPSITVTAFVTSVLIQRETGGNLTELLGQLSRTIRERFAFQGKVRSASAEGRASAWVLTMIPFVLTAMLTATSPDYIVELVREPTGHKLIGAAFGFIIVGILWIKRIIRIDV